jgi:hypothetical protein
LLVAPAAIAPVLVFSVVDPAVSRVTDAPALLVPRLRTDTVNVTACPTAGFAGFDAMPTTSRSGPGDCPTTSCVGDVKVLLVSFCSTTVFVGSTVAATL